MSASSDLLLWRNINLLSKLARCFTTHMLDSAEINRNKRSHKSSLRVNTEWVNRLCTRSVHISRLVSQAAKNLLEKTTQLCIHSLSQRVSDAFQSNESFNNVTPGVVYILGVSWGVDVFLEEWMCSCKSSSCAVSSSSEPSFGSSEWMNHFTNWCCNKSVS